MFTPCGSRRFFLSVDRRDFLQRICLSDKCFAEVRRDSKNLPCRSIRPFDRLSIPRYPFQSHLLYSIAPPNAGGERFWGLVSNMRNIPRLTTTVILRKLAGAAVILLLFSAVFLAYFKMRGAFAPPLSMDELFHFEIHQLDIGTFLQLMILPILLLMLMSLIPYFNRQLLDQPLPRATVAIFAGFAVIQLISQGYDIWTYRSMNQPVIFGLVVILAGSLLGGWRIGLPLGVISMIFQCGYEVFASSPFLTNVQDMGIWGFLRGFNGQPFLNSSFILPNYSGGLWAAVFACMIADWLGPRRYSAFAAAAQGGILPFAVGYLQLAAGVPPGLLGVPAQALVTGIAAAWIMLMIRYVQVESSRKKTAEAELAKTRAELRALRSQINPHFFFNSLNTIRFMIREDPQKARDLLIDLSEVFQRTLRSGDFVALRDELGYVEAYLSLEKARLGDRLRIVWGGLLKPDKPLESDTPLLDAPVPTLALQPIVENAVLHGIGKKKEGGTVGIAVSRRQKDFAITVEDDGVGMDSRQLESLLQPGDENHKSIGMKNVDTRLRMLYGPEYRLAIESQPGKGTRVTVRIPISESKGQA
jgi:signal transduction histidine kinase